MSVEKYQKEQSRLPMIISLGIIFLIVGCCQILKLLLTTLTMF